MWLRARSGQEGGEKPAPAPHGHVLFSSSSPQFSLPRLAGTWSPRQRRSSYRGPPRNSSLPAHSKCPLPAQAGPPHGPGEGLPLLSTWSAGPGAGLPCPRPQPSRAAVCILLTIGKDTKGPSPNKTSASKGVESKWLSRLLRQKNVQKLDPVWVVWESFPAPTPHCCQQPEPGSAAAGRGLEATLAAPCYLVCRPYGHPDGIGDKSVGVLLARHQGSPDLSLAHIL